MFVDEEVRRSQTLCSPPSKQTRVQTSGRLGIVVAEDNLDEAPLMGSADHVVTEYLSEPEHEIIRFEGDS